MRLKVFLYTSAFKKFEAERLCEAGGWRCAAPLDVEWCIGMISDPKDIHRELWWAFFAAAPRGSIVANFIALCVTARLVFEGVVRWIAKPVDVRLSVFSYFDGF